VASSNFQLSDEIVEYLRRVSVREPDILVRLREETQELDSAPMQISPEQSAFLSMLISLLDASRALEVGVFTGYSSLVTALALPDDGHLTACDISEAWTNIAQRYWREAGVAEKIDLKLGPAIATLGSLLGNGAAKSYDFAFIDADKENYVGYYERALELVRPGGLIAIDNVPWSGRVADPSDTESSTEAIRALNEQVAQDSRVNACIVPIGDGLTLARVNG
jgi:caffeoyl-CoA O-methyltransferase